MPIIESIAIWAVCTLAGTWLGHEGREEVSFRFFLFSFFFSLPFLPFPASLVLTCGHFSSLQYSSDTPSKWSNASNLVKYCRGTLASSPPPPPSFPPPLRAPAYKLPSTRDFASTLSYEEWARLLVKGDERLGLKNPDRVS